MQILSSLKTLGNLKLQRTAGEMDPVYQSGRPAPTFWVRRSLPRTTIKLNDVQHNMTYDAMGVDPLLHPWILARIHMALVNRLRGTLG